MEFLGSLIAIGGAMWGQPYLLSTFNTTRHAAYRYRLALVQLAAPEPAPVQVEVLPEVMMLQPSVVPPPAHDDDALIMSISQLIEKATKNPVCVCRLVLVTCACYIISLGMWRFFSSLTKTRSESAGRTSIVARAKRYAVASLFVFLVPVLSSFLVLHFIPPFFIDLLGIAGSGLLVLLHEQQDKSQFPAAHEEAPEENAVSMVAEGKYLSRRKAS